MTKKEKPRVTRKRRESPRTKQSALICALSTLFAVNLFCTFTGCNASTDRRAEIVFWAMGAEGEHVAKLMPEFERRHPGIKVRVQMIPWNAAHEKLLTSYAGNSLPDLTQLGNTWIPEFHLLNCIEDLTPYVRQSSTVKDTSYFAGIWDTNVIDSSLFGLPWYVDTRVLFYRTDLLERAGYSRAPVSWDEWYDVSKKLVDGKIAEHGVFFPTNNEWASPVLMAVQLGSPLLKENATRGDFSGKQFRSALHAFDTFFQNGWAPIKTTQIVNIYQGMADRIFAMHITGPWNIGEFSRRMPPELQDKWSTAPLPGPDGKIGASLAGGSSLVMFKNSEHKNEIWQLIEYLSEPAVQTEFYGLTGDLPARTESWRDTTLANNKYAQAFFHQLKHVVPMPKTPEWEQIAQKVREYVELVSMNRLTVEDATLALDKDVDQMLEKRRWMLSSKP
ncbi:MAG: sugar ABC transporter substrate-binding protein [Ignavibacteriae bacterium]|nr:sugar ABC transporter substrate-binding protein [Ignavibacteriota bacterium]